MTTSLISHPEIQRITEENDLLREELTKLLTEAEDLVNTIKPNLLALYQTKIGVWELRLLQAKFRVARLRRQIELAQASINRGERPNIAVIECTIETEFLSWLSKLEETAQRIREAEDRLKHLLSPAEDRELKRLYYAIVKRLHPDVNPGTSSDNQRLWLRAQSAYENGDLAELRALSLLVGKSIATPKTLDQLRQDQAVLESQIIAMIEKLELIEAHPPFTVRPQLEDEIWLTTRRQDLDRQTAELCRQGDVLNKHWQALIGGIEHGTSFSQN